MMFNALYQTLGLRTKTDFLVTGLNLNSQLIKQGEIFIALSGTKQHGIDFAQDAIKKGACAILVEDESGIDFDLEAYSVPCFKVLELGSKLSQLAAIFYGTPSAQMTGIAITGTNGKSSIAYSLANMCQNYLGHTAVVGTVGYGLGGMLHKASHTTPDAIALQKMLAHFKEQKVDYLVMEASSHGLEQGRLKAVNITTAIYTNLTRDHQDFHETMDNYAKAKQKLFAMPSVQNALINVNDEFGQTLFERYQSKLNLVSYGINIAHQGAYLSAESIEQNTDGSQFKLCSSWGDETLHTSLLGLFNIENILAMVGGFLLSGGLFSDVFSIVADITPLDGRMECFGGGKKPLVVVDYAHTPDALSQSLLALKSHMNDCGSLYCIFGCGGDRDKGKRPQMAQVAQELADYIIVTDDNPRTESPEAIVADIMEGFNEQARVNISHDRQQAIFAAIHSAKAGDIILLAGKGHETEQIIGTQVNHFSDREKVQEALC